MKPTLTILKIGGNVVDDQAALARALDYFVGLTGAAILVHGGGKQASDFGRRLGVVPRMVDGRRLTDAASLEVVTMVYAGLINKNVVAQLQARHCPAIGLSGADANLIVAHQRQRGEIDYGYVGDIDTVNVAALSGLLAQELRPVVCPITHDGQGQLLNTNADTVAAQLAVAMAPRFALRLQFCFERPGVLRDAADDHSIIPHLDAAAYAHHRAAGHIHSGMLPKLDNAFAAISAGVAEVTIGNLDSLQSGTATRISHS